jgi:hypothetical protein
MRGDITITGVSPRKMEGQQKVRRKADMESLGQWFVPSSICWRKAVDVDWNEEKSTLKSLNRCV